MKIKKFSKINTEIKFVNNKILKIYNINHTKQIDIKMLRFIKNEILNYYNEIKKSNILTADLYNLKIKNKKIHCSMSYEGKNLLQSGLSYKNYLENLNYVIQCLDLLNLAYKNKIFIDPHIKNFVLNKEKEIKYVDIYQPLTSRYMKYRINQSTSLLEKKIIKKNFDYFSYKYIFFHFFADLVKVNKNFLKYKNLYLKIIEDKYSVKVSKINFLKIIYKIKKIELQREKLKIFLI
jgi:hypothetical protein